MVEIWPLLCEGVGHWGRSEGSSASAVGNLTADGRGGHGQCAECKGLSFGDRKVAVRTEQL